MNRTKNDFGHLKIENCTLTGESVDEYMGSELPQLSGIDKNTVYRIYRPLEEIKKGLDTYNNVPVVDEHHFVGEDTPNRSKWLGTTGENAIMKDGKLINTIHFWDNKGTELAENWKQGLSCGYSFTLVTEDGVFDGKNYDFKMADIKCNHVALVEKPRVKTAKLADSKNKGAAMNALENLLKILKQNPDLLTDSNEELEKINASIMAFDEKMKMKDKDKDEDEDEDEDEDKAEDAEKDEDEDEDKDDDDKSSKDAKDKESETESRKERADVDKYEYEEGKKAEKKEMKSKDKRAKDMAQDAATIARKMIIDFNETKTLVEKVIGQTHFAADATPDEMMDEALKAKGEYKKGMSTDVKRSLLSYMAKQGSKHLAIDSIKISSKDDGYKSIFIK